MLSWTTLHCPLIPITVIEYLCLFASPK
jgi:hypothetical protein